MTRSGEGPKWESHTNAPSAFDGSKRYIEKREGEKVRWVRRGEFAEWRPRRLLFSFSCCVWKRSVSAASLGKSRDTSLSWHLYALFFSFLYIFLERKWCAVSLKHKCLKYLQDGAVKNNLKYWALNGSKFNIIFFILTLSWWILNLAEKHRP